MSAASVATYIAGQCTAFVAQALNWIPGGLGNAGDWLANAAAKGLPESTHPAVGDAAVWNPNQSGAGFAGHVADVIGVNPAMGTITVEEMNWTYGPFHSDVRTIPAASVAGFIEPPGSAPGGGATGLSSSNASLPAQSGNSGNIATTQPISFNIGGLSVPTTGLPGLDFLGGLASLFGIDVKTLLIRALLIVFGLVIIVVGIHVLFNASPKTTVEVASQNVGKTKGHFRQHAEEAGEAAAVA